MRTTADRTLTITVACVATAMLILDISVVNTALSDIAADLDAELSGLQWVVDAYTLPLAATVLTAGVLADRHGRRRWFGLGLALFTIASCCARGAGPRRLDHVRDRACAHRPGEPDDRGARESARRLRRDHRSGVRDRPVRRRRAD